MTTQAVKPSSPQEKPLALVAPAPQTHTPPPWVKPTFTQLALREALASPVGYDITGTEYAMS